MILLGIAITGGLHLPEAGLRRIKAGFYVNEENLLFVNVREILAAFDLPDTPEVRQAIWDEIRRDFGVIPIREIEDP